MGRQSRVLPILTRFSFFFILGTYTNIGVSSPNFYRLFDLVYPVVLVVPYTYYILPQYGGVMLYLFSYIKV